MSPTEGAGPSEREEPGAIPGAGPNHKSGIAIPTNQAQPIAAGRQCRRNTVGRHADAVISPDHLAMLAASGITPEHAALRGYETITDKRRLAELKIAAAGRNLPGLLVPLRRADCSQWGDQYRPDNPRLRGKNPHFIADRAKYCEAVLMYQLAQMQYYIGELAHTGRLNRGTNYDLQWRWFGGDGITYDLWAGIVEATVDWSLDGGDFHTYFYGDGRVIMTQIDLQLPMGVEDAIWPHDHDLCGDGPIWKHPRGTICYIEPVEPQSMGYPCRAITVDITRVLEGYAAAKAALSDAELLDLSNELANEAAAEEPWPDTTNQKEDN